MGDSTNRNSHQRNLGHCRRSHLNLRIPSACRDSVADQHALLRWIPYNVKFFSLLNACELLTYTALSPPQVPPANCWNGDLSTPTGKIQASRG